MRFFITGGARGIGAQMVEDLVRAGHDVAFTYMTSEKEANEVAARALSAGSGRTCVCFRLDVRDPAATEEVCDRAVDALGGLEVVVPNAGISRNALLVETADDDWRAVIDTNLTGAFHVCRQLIPVLLAERFGRVIFVSSVGQGGGAGQAAYSASKAGLLGLSGAIAKEYGRRGITSNALVLGIFETEMTRVHMGQRNRDYWSAFCPAGRTGQLAEVSEAVLFLASKTAGFVNGAELHLTGGLDWTP